MTTKTTKTSKASKTTRRLTVDAEARALMAIPAFRAALEEAQRARPEDLIPAEDLARDLGITDSDREIAREYLDALDRLEQEQDAEVTEEQARVLEVVLTAARYLRGEGMLAALAEDTGIAEADIRAAAVALAALGLPAARAPSATPMSAPPAAGARESHRP